MKFSDYFHLPAITAGFIAVLVGFTSSAAIVFQAAKAAGATPDQIGSWVMALGIGMGVTTIGLSLRYKAPIITAWSTPGAALLATSLTGVPMAEAIGAFIFSAVLMIVCGITGWFEKIISRIPLPIAGAMLAGILFQFGIDVFNSMEHRLLLVGCMFITYLLMKKMLPRYAIVIVLIVGLAVCQFQGLLNFDGFEFVAVKPQFIIPVFSFNTLVSIGIPLFVVTMVSQNIPGIAVLRSAGYQTPLSPLISWTGIATLLLAPLGGYALNLAAITAAICTGEEAHEDPNKRYIATLSAGFFYLLLGISGAAVVGLLRAFPTEFVLALAGLALIGTIASSLNTAVSEAKTREAAIITFLVTASGMTVFGIGSAFWGLVVGFVAVLVLNGRLNLSS
ncbi:MAG: benzoate membrane transport protein [Polaribacter sp.]|jgi:benzoate membrane transport protein